MGKSDDNLPHPDLRGEIGLYLSDTCVRVRNVILTPLKPLVIKE